MKKILTALSIGFTSFTVLTSCVYAQSSVKPIAFHDAKTLKSSIRNMAALESPATMGTYIPDAKKVNAKAIKDFTGRYAEASDAKWYSDKNGFVSYFVKDGFGDRVFYDKKGHWQYSLIFYTEDKLPRDVRAAVRSTYYDMPITLVEEVQTTEAKVFIVHIEDRSNIKILKVSEEGEMQILQELTKE
jgi:hypothetical protein